MHGYVIIFGIEILIGAMKNINSNHMCDPTIRLNQNCHNLCSHKKHIMFFCPKQNLEEIAIIIVQLYWLQTRELYHICCTVSPVWSYICHNLPWITRLRTNTGASIVPLTVNGSNGVHVSSSLVLHLLHSRDISCKVDILRTVTSWNLESIGDIREDKDRSSTWEGCLWSGW